MVPIKEFNCRLNKATLLPSQTKLSLSQTKLLENMIGDGLESIVEVGFLRLDSFSSTLASLDKDIKLG